MEKIDTNKNQDVELVLTNKGYSFIQQKVKTERCFVVTTHKSHKEHVERDTVDYQNHTHSSNMFEKSNESLYPSRYTKIFAKDCGITLHQ